MNKAIPIAAALIGIMLLVGCLGIFGGEETENGGTEETTSYQETMQGAEKALNSTLSELEDLELSNLTVEEEL